MDEKQSQMKASEELTSKKDLIKQILTDYPQFRDSDRALCAFIWQSEMNDLGFTNFPLNYSQGYFTSADSISRLKRLIQKENEHLRGINKDSEEEKCRELFTGELNFPKS